MNKSQLIKCIADKSGLTKKDSELALDTALEVITDVLANNDTVKLPNFGNFEPRTRKARIGHNPQTMVEVTIPESKTVGFKPADKLKKDIS